MAVRLQAIAELAAAVQVGIGLKIGDFLEMAEADPRMEGLPTELLRIFLSEISVGGGVYAKAALTAQAYAQLVIVGTAIDQPHRGLRAGFNIIAGMGAGLKAGAGFRAFASLEFDNFSRFVARSVDLMVNEAVEAVIAGLRPEENLERMMLQAAKPGFKIPFRLAYEMGEHLALARPGGNAVGVASVALRCTQVFLEESQRFLLESMIEAAQAAFADSLRGWSGSLAKSAWNASLSRRQALASHLAQAPREPFMTDAPTLAWWRDAAVKMADVISALGAQLPMPGATIGASMFWAASELAMVASTRAARVDASVSVAGTAPHRATMAFAGPLTSQPPQPVLGTILTTLGLPASTVLDRQHLVAYLTTGPAMDLLLRYVPAAGQFLSKRTGPMGASPKDILRTILANGAAFVPASGGQFDPRASLAAISSSLSREMMTEVSGLFDRLLQENRITDPGLRTAVEEILLPSIHLAFDTALSMALNGSAQANQAEALQEALSTVLMKLVGRSLVLTADIMLVATQTQIGDVLEDLARVVDGPKGIVSVLSKAANLPVPASEIGEVIADALRIGAETLGPLSNAQRTRIRGLLYEVIDGLPPGMNGDALMNQLADPSFMPNAAAMRSLAMELMGISGERFLHFFQRLVILIASKAIEELLEAIEEQKRQIREWLAEAQRSVDALQRSAEQMARAATEALEQAAASLKQASGALLDVFSPLSDRAGRTALREALADKFIANTLEKLERNDIYRTLAPPPVKQAMRQITRKALEHAFDNALLDSILTLIGQISRDLSDLMDKARRLDPDHDLVPQLRSLVKTELSAALESRLGHDKQIVVGFEIEIAGQRMHVNLGRITLPTESIAAAVSSAIVLLPSFEISVRAAALALAAAHREEQRAREKRLSSQRAAERSQQIRKKRSGITNAALGLRIHSPTEAKVAGPSLLVDFEVSGADRAEIVGNDLSPPLVQLHLNGEPLPLTGFSVEVGIARPGRPDARAATTVPRSALRSMPPTVGLAERIARVPTLGEASRLIGTLPPAPLGHVASAQATRFSRRMALDELEEGLNTLVISIHDGSGQSRSTSVAFFVPAQPVPPARGAVRIERGRPTAIGLPKAVAGKFLLATKASRKATSGQARDKARADGLLRIKRLKAMRQIVEG